MEVLTGRVKFTDIRHDVVMQKGTVNDCVQTLLTFRLTWTYGFIVEKIIHWHVYIFTMHHPWRDTWHMTGWCGALVLGQAPPSLTGRTYTVCLWEDMKIGQSEIPCHSSISSCYSSFIRLVVHPLLFCPCSASSPPLSLSLCLCQHMMRHVGDHPQVCCSANWTNITD